MRPSGPRTLTFHTIPISPWVKRLVMLNVGLWFGIQLILEGLIMGRPVLTHFLALTPQKWVEHYFIWQAFTYMFLHSPGVLHVVLNMIALWFFGSELEYRWGRYHFLYYYLACGVGSALIYVLATLIIGLVQGVPPEVYEKPLVGASGAIFGVLLAYGILFGERIIYFFGVFPMKAKFFLLIIGGIEVASLLSSGMGKSPVANMAHLGGLISGYIYLISWTRYQQSKWRMDRKNKAKRSLRLVVNNRRDQNPDAGPKYWH